MNKKRNFAKTALLGVLLCGLAGPTFVGCKDYDDDIKDLQEQIDVNKAKVDADAMNKAIQAEITKLQNELTQAINGKASASEISAHPREIRSSCGFVWQSKHVRRKNLNIRGEDEFK